MSRSGRQQATQGEISHAPTHTLTARSGVFFLHHPSRTARRIVGVSAASKNQEAKEKPPPHGDPTPRMKHFPPLHADPAPQMKQFSPLHGVDRAIMKFSSPTHTQNAQFPTIFTVLGRYFFHRGTPHDHTVLRRGDLSFTHPPGAPQHGGHRKNQAHPATQNLTTEPAGRGRARPQKSRMQFD